MLKWLKKIDAYIQTPEKEFVLVGVGHMVGEDGLINQLEMRGYQVTQLAIGKQTGPATNKK